MLVHMFGEIQESESAQVFICCSNFGTRRVWSFLFSHLIGRGIWNHKWVDVA